MGQNTVLSPAWRGCQLAQGGKCVALPQWDHVTQSREYYKHEGRKEEEGNFHNIALRSRDIYENNSRSYGE